MGFISYVFCMKEERLDKVKDSIDRIYGLKSQLENKISSWNIWSDSDRSELLNIREESLKTLVVLLDFCDAECSNPENKQANIIIEIKSKLRSNLDFNNLDSFSYSALNWLEPVLADLFNYVATKKSNLSEPKNKSFVDLTFGKIKNLFKSNATKDSPIEIYEIVVPGEQEKDVSTDVIQPDEVTEINEVDESDEDDQWSDEDVSGLKKTDYLYRLNADRKNILANLDISEEITEINYKDVLDEYEDHIFSYNKNKQLHNMLNARIRKYKAYCSKSKKADRRWEALLYVQSLLKREVKEEVDEFDLHKQEQIRQKEKEQELLRNQSIHFPKIISLLRKFKKIFAAEYFSKSPAEVREAFVEQYTSLVLDPVVKINPELLSLSDRESRALQHTHRKIELYQYIPSIISKGSDDLIINGISKWFIFGEIDDLIQFMQKTYKENIIA